MKEKYSYTGIVDDTYQFDDVCEDLALEAKGKIVIDETIQANGIVVIETDTEIASVEDIMDNVEGLIIFCTTIKYSLPN